MIKISFSNNKIINYLERKNKKENDTLTKIVHDLVVTIEMCRESCNTLYLI